MKPCGNNKRRLAWMASGVLDAKEAQALRQHLESCPGCRRYWQSMSELTARLVTAGNLPPTEPSAWFHQKVVQKIKTQETRSSGFLSIITRSRLWLERRVATVSVGIALGIAALLWLQSIRRDEPRVPSEARMAVVPETAERAASPPSLAAYRRAAEVSIESLDALLTDHAARTSPAGKTFTASSLLTLSLEH